MPTGVTLLQNGVLYVMDTDGTEVCRIDMASGSITANAIHIGENDIQDFNINLPDVNEDEFIRVLNGG